MIPLIFIGPLLSFVTLTRSQRNQFGTSREIGNTPFSVPNFGQQQDDTSFGSQGNFIPNPNHDFTQGNSIPNPNRDFTLVDNIGREPPPQLFPVTPRNPNTFNTFNSFTTIGPQRNFGVIQQGPGQFFGDGFQFTSPEEKECPQGWDTFKQSCYRFIRPPTHKWEDAKRNCQAYGNGADLLSLNTIEEHTWIVRKLTAFDPQHRVWYVSGRQISPGNWVNADSVPLTALDHIFLQDQPSIVSNPSNNYLAYSYSERRKLWGLLKVSGEDLLLYICEIPLAQVPYIDKTLEDRDFDYGVEVEDVRKIPRGPHFIKEPQNTVFDLSRNIHNEYVSLNCLADGWPAPSYKWFKEEYINQTMSPKYLDPLADSKYTVSGGMLIIDSPRQVDDRGSYHCIATNIYGSVVSDTVSISFGYIGEFITSRSVEIASQYWGKAIFCDPPNHFPSVLFSWSRRYFPNFVEEDKRVFVSYDGNLYISSVEISDKDDYICHVQNTVSSNGRTGPTFPLQVTPNSNYQQLKFPNNFPKAFPESPTAGEDVRLECVAFGYPVPSYNWTRKGAPIPRNSVLSNYNRVLTIPKVKVEDQGEYICHAANNRLSTEDGVTLSIQAAPTFPVPLGHRHMDKGDNLTWICEAFGIPDVSYQWYKDGKLLIPEEVFREFGPRYVMRDNVLMISNLDAAADAGMYQCRANNSLTAKFSVGQLRVLTIPPSFKKRPVASETLAAEHGNVTIRCQPEAAPRPQFQWRKDGGNIHPGGTRRILPDGSLVINPVSTQDEGIYTCLARNILGIDESSGRLSVLQGPSLMDIPAETENYTIGSQLFLQCQAAADPSLDISYSWKLNGVRLDDMTHRIRIDPRAGYVEIDNLTLADRGDYECEVNTWVGSVRRVTHVHIMGPPGPVGGVSAEILNSRTGRIRWTDGAMNGAQAYLYTLQGKTQWDKTWRNLLENTEPDRGGVDARIRESSRKEKLVNVLSPWSTYEFRIVAANKFGYGTPSAPSPQVRTPSNRPSIYPRNIHGGGGKTGTLTMLWDPLHPRDHSAPGIYYKVFWRLNREHSEEPYQSVTLRKWGNIGSHVVNIPSTHYYTLYDVKVQAWNDECSPDDLKGCGPESPPVPVYSAEDMPQVAPSLVTPMPFNSTAIIVNWTPVDESREKMRGKLIGYRLRYWRKIETNLYDPEALNYLSRSTKPQALIVGLLPNTYYYVQVMAYNAAGPGPASEPQFERTLRKAPQKPPVNVQVSLVNPTTIKVTWRYLATTAQEEALSGFKVRIWDADQDMATANDTVVDFVDRSLEQEVTGLLPAKKYIVRVLAYSPGGDGKMSPPQEIVLGDPEALKNHQYRTSSSVMLTLLGFLLTTHYWSQQA